MSQLDYMADIEGRGLAALPDADIAAALTPCTAQDIAVEAVRIQLRERNLWLKDPITRAWSFGTIGQAMQAEGFPVELYDALVALEAALYDQSATRLRTHQHPGIARQVADTLTGLVATGAMTSDDVAAFYALGGGLQFPDGVTAEDIAGARAEQEFNTQRLDLRTGVDAICNAAGSLTELLDGVDALTAGMRS